MIVSFLWVVPVKLPYKVVFSTFSFLNLGAILPIVVYSDNMSSPVIPLNVFDLNRDPPHVP